MRIATVDRYCNGCMYLTRMSGDWFCDYISATGERRGCPAGVGCVRRTMGGKAVSMAALHELGKIPPTIKNPKVVRTRQDWEDIERKHQERKRRLAEECQARCAGRQKAAIAKWMKANRATQRELADLIGVDAKTISQWFCETRPAKWSLLEKVGVYRPIGM